MRSITINGEEKELVFKYGTFRILGELTKKDPFKLTIDYNDVQKVYQYGFFIIYAGLIKAGHKVTQAEVQNAVDELDFPEVLEIITEFLESTDPKKEEAVPQ